MSDASPAGALDALISRTVKFAGREIAITCGALLAVESLGGEEAKNESFVAWTLLAVSSLGVSKCLPALRSASGVLPLVLDWAAKLTKEERAEALIVASRLVSFYSCSKCVYVSAFEQGTEKQIECGNAAMNAGFFLREYRLTFEQYFDFPATRANALYAAWCDAQGMQGKDTFWNREKLAEAPAMFAKLNFDYADDLKKRSNG